MEIKLPEAGLRIAEQGVSRQQVGQFIESEVRNREGIALPAGGQGLAMESEKAGPLGVPQQAILGNKLFELFDGEVVIRAIKANHVENLFLSVVEVDGPRRWTPRNDLEEQDAVRHLDPAAGDGVADLQEFALQ